MHLSKKVAAEMFSQSCTTPFVCQNEVGQKLREVEKQVVAGGAMSGLCGGWSKISRLNFSGAH
jgi:hypothetical protein